MKKLVFEIEDFDWSCMSSAQACAKAAQAKFDVWFKDNIESAPVVWFNDDKTMSPFWEASSKQDELHTHSARLVMIEEIKKECKHPQNEFIIFPSSAGKARCGVCGVNFVAEWKEVKP